MDFELGYDEATTGDNPEATDIELPRPPVCKKNKEILKKYAPIYQEDYHEFKKSFMKWLLMKGKSPQKYEAYSETTVIQTHYKIEETYRWVWSHREEYTKTFDPDEATKFLKYLQKRAGKDDNYLDYIRKSVKRLFNYWRDSDNRRIEEWDHGIEIRTDHGNNEKKGHDRFRPHEFPELYDAAIGLNAVKSYYNRDMSSDERDRIKIMLAQRLGKPKNEIGPEDFQRANSWKIPSLIAVTLDTGLRPIEVGKARTGWFDIDNGEMQVPKEDATKNNEYWECGLSDTATNAILKWLKERETYDKYRGEKGMWLTERGNPYSSGPLNNILNKLIKESNIKPGDRDLVWYSIRHGVATHWAEQKGIYKAKKQLRHKDIETTLGYTHHSGSTLSREAEEMW